jgi:hypothetical protein
MAQNRIIACRHANTRHQSFAGPAANAMAKHMNEFGGPPGAAISCICSSVARMLCYGIASVACEA